MQGTGGGGGEATDVGGGGGGHGGDRCWCSIAECESLVTAASIGQGGGQVKY